MYSCAISKSAINDRIHLLENHMETGEMFSFMTSNVGGGIPTWQLQVSCIITGKSESMVPAALYWFQT